MSEDTFLTNHIFFARCNTKLDPSLRLLLLFDPTFSIFHCIYISKSYQGGHLRHQMFIDVSLCLQGTCAPRGKSGTWGRRKMDVKGQLVTRVGGLKVKGMNQRCRPWVHERMGGRGVSLRVP